MTIHLVSIALCLYGLAIVIVWIALTHKAGWMGFCPDLMFSYWFLLWVMMQFGIAVIGTRFSLSFNDRYVDVVYAAVNDR